MAVTLWSSGSPGFDERKYPHPDGGSSHPAAGFGGGYEMKTAAHHASMWGGTSGAVRGNGQTWTPLLSPPKKLSKSEIEEKRICDLFETDRKAFWGEVGRLYMDGWLLANAWNISVRRKVIEQLDCGDISATGLFSALNDKKRQKLTADYLTALDFKEKYTSFNKVSILEMTDDDIRWVWDLLEYLKKHSKSFWEENKYNPWVLQKGPPSNYGLGLQGLTGRSDKESRGNYETVSKDQWLNEQVCSAIGDLVLYGNRDVLPRWTDNPEPRYEKGENQRYQTIRERAAGISLSLVQWLEMILLRSMRGWEALVPHSLPPPTPIPALSQTALSTAAAVEAVLPAAVRVIPSDPAPVQGAVPSLVLDSRLPLAADSASSSVDNSKMTAHVASAIASPTTAVESASPVAPLGIVNVGKVPRSILKKGENRPQATSPREVHFQGVDDSKEKSREEATGNQPAVERLNTSTTPSGAKGVATIIGVPSIKEAIPRSLSDSTPTTAAVVAGPMADAREVPAETELVTASPIAVALEAALPGTLVASPTAAASVPANTLNPVLDSTPPVALGPVGPMEPGPAGPAAIVVPAALVVPAAPPETVSAAASTPAAAAKEVLPTQVDAKVDIKPVASGAAAAQQPTRRISSEQLRKLRRREVFTLPDEELQKILGSKAK